MNYLNVPFAQKDHVKILGARWDVTEKKWYVPDGVALEPFGRWLSGAPVIAAQTGNQDESKGVSLAVFLRQASLALKKAIPVEQWIRAEISQYKELNGGHVSIELVEHNEQGQLSARIQSFIWTSHARRVADQFTMATGGPLKTGLKVMVKASIDMHLTSNTRLIITDIDPSYTLGDIEANLKKIRAILTKEGVIDANKKLARPSEFCRVAIISPNAAAGLGDFKRDADILEEYNLCSFDYFSAQFQGQGAAESILSALREVSDRHAVLQYDALCIIRGGGSATDLYWLNDLDLARAVCLTTIPVFTGIGHERDNTILDEVSHSRFDTPSKVVGHIRSTIQSNAVEAEKDFQSILLYVDRITAAADKDVESLFADIRQDVTIATHLMENKVDQLFLSIKPSVEQLLYKAGQDVEQSFQFIKMRCESDLLKATGEIDRYFEWVSTSTLHNLSSFEQAIDQFFLSIREHGAMQLFNANREIESLCREILGLGPRATLNRGFAIARSADGQAIVSAEQAKQYPELNIEFRDGVISVKQV